jgi:mannose-6-phosphate isomerase-like protein (cupin superfamily)
MLVRALKDCREIIAGDRSVLRELLHPGKTKLKLRYSLAHAAVAPGRATLPHRLRTSEVYYILAGKGIMSINDEQKPVRAGQAIYIPPCARQYIRNPGRTRLKFLCIVDPAWTKADEIVEHRSRRAARSAIRNPQ